jgi:hypothetical protein
VPKYFSRIYLIPVFLENSWKKEKDFSFAGYIPTRRPSPQGEAGPAPRPSLPPVLVGPDALVAPLVRDRCLCAGPLVGIFFPQIPSPAPRALAPVGKSTTTTATPRPATCRRCCSSCRFACARCSTDMSPSEMRCRLALLCQPPDAMAVVPPGCSELRS